MIKLEWGGEGIFQKIIEMGGGVKIKVRGVKTSKSVIKWKEGRINSRRWSTLVELSL